jgi:hypothetical protein
MLLQSLKVRRRFGLDASGFELSLRLVHISETKRPKGTRTERKIRRLGFVILEPAFHSYVLILMTGNATVIKIEHGLIVDVARGDAQRTYSGFRSKRQ